MVRLASLGAVWRQGVIPQVQTTRWTGGPDFFFYLSSIMEFVLFYLYFLFTLFILDKVGLEGQIHLYPLNFPLKGK